jgi:hypothetical protein
MAGGRSPSRGAMPFELPAPFPGTCLDETSARFPADGSFGRPSRTGPSLNSGFMTLGSGERSGATVNVRKLRRGTVRLTCAWEEEAQ